MVVEQEHAPPKAAGGRSAPATFAPGRCEDRARCRAGSPHRSATRSRNDAVFLPCALRGLSGPPRARWWLVRGLAPGRARRNGVPNARFLFLCAHSAVSQIARAHGSSLTFIYSQHLPLVYFQSLWTWPGPGRFPVHSPGYATGLRPAAAGIHTIARWNIRSWAMDAGRWHAARRPGNRRSHSLRQHQSAKNG